MVILYFIFLHSFSTQNTLQLKIQNSYKWNDPKKRQNFTENKLLSKHQSNQYIPHEKSQPHFNISLNDVGGIYTKTVLYEWIDLFIKNFAANISAEVPYKAFQETSRFTELIDNIVQNETWQRALMHKLYQIHMYDKDNKLIQDQDISVSNVTNFDKEINWLSYALIVDMFHNLLEDYKKSPQVTRNINSIILDKYVKRKRSPQSMHANVSGTAEDNPIIDIYGGMKDVPSSDFKSLQTPLKTSQHEHNQPSIKAVWGYAILFVTLICLCSMVGAVFISFMKKKYYKYILQFMIGLAMGSLSGSAVFHLIPQTFDLVDNDEHHLYINKSATIIAGIYLFLITEWLIKITLQHRNKTKVQRKEAKRIAAATAVTNNTGPNGAVNGKNGTTLLSNNQRPFTSAPTRKRVFKRAVNALTCRHCYSSSDLYKGGNNHIPFHKHRPARDDEIRPNGSIPSACKSNVPYNDPEASKRSHEAYEAKESLIRYLDEYCKTSTAAPGKKYPSDPEILDEISISPFLTRSTLLTDTSCRPRSKSCSANDVAAAAGAAVPPSLQTTSNSKELITEKNNNNQQQKQLSRNENLHSSYNPSCSIYFNQYPGIIPSPGFPNFEPFLDRDEPTVVVTKTQGPTSSPPPSPIITKTLKEEEHVDDDNNQMIRTCSHEDLHAEGQSAIVTLAYMILLGDGLHNFIDGLSIGAAFSRNILTGVSISLAVIFEELPHELGDFAILLNSGMPVRKAMLCNFLSASTCYLGMICGIFLGENKETSFYIFALAAGMFLYISLVDMMPELNKIIEKANKSGNLPLTLVIQYSGIALGLISMSLLAKYGTIISI